MKKSSFILLLLCAIPLVSHAQNDSIQRTESHHMQALGWFVGSWEWNGIHNGEKEISTVMECDWIFGRRAIECLEYSDGGEAKIHFSYSHLTNEYLSQGLYSAKGLGMMGVKGRVFHREGKWYELIETYINGMPRTDKFVYTLDGNEVNIEQYHSTYGMPEERVTIAKMTRI